MVGYKALGLEICVNGFPIRVNFQLGRKRLGSLQPHERVLEYRHWAQHYQQAALKYRDGWRLPIFSTLLGNTFRNLNLDVSKI
ncbi:MAG: hypothetical protein ACI9GW_003240 [Halieaceae bacterium]|jgi:hypothetical protein